MARGEGTDCSIPMRRAADREADFDGFAIFTDGQTWAGPQPPISAMAVYRGARVAAAKMVSVSRHFVVHSPRLRAHLHGGRHEEAAASVGEGEVPGRSKPGHQREPTRDIVHEEAAIGRSGPAAPRFAVLMHRVRVQHMSRPERENVIFTEAEVAYLQSQRLGRLATMRSDGTLQNNPVGFRVDPEAGVIEIHGRNLGETAKFRNVASNGRVAFVVDDIVSVTPWVVRCFEVRGVGEALTGQPPPSPYFSPEVIRIHPWRIISWGLGPDGSQASRRDVTP